MTPSQIAVLVALPLSIAFAVYGLSVLHRQRVAGGVQGRALAWAIAGISFLSSAFFGYLLYVRLWVASVMAGG